MKYLIIILISFSIIGCGSSPKKHKYKYEKKIDEVELNLFMQDKPAPYRPFFDVYLRQGARNSVLNEVRIGLLAFNNGEYDLAGWLFDRAILKIETVYANNKTAKKARSKFTQEEVKDFKGDPYERAMVYLYRGLVYLQKDDYENARASMLGGLLQDSLAEDQEYEQDFATLYYLAAWASQCNGNQSQSDDYYKHAIKYKPKLAKPHKKNNVLIIATSGISPIKRRQGKYNEQMFFDVGSDLASYKMATPSLTVKSKKVNFVNSENLHWQATTRGGRTIDIINEGKAVFKDNTEKTGDAFLQTGSALMTSGQYTNNQDVGNAGAVFALIGLFSKGLSKASKPTADIRYWDNLPSLIYLTTANKKALKKGPLEFIFIDNASQSVDDKSTEFNSIVMTELEPDKTCDLVIISNKSKSLTYRHINQ